LINMEDQYGNTGFIYTFNWLGDITKLLLFTERLKTHKINISKLSLRFFSWVNSLEWDSISQYPKSEDTHILVWLL